MDAFRLSKRNFHKRSTSSNPANPQPQKRNGSPLTPDELGEQYLVFDRLAYERDGRIIRLLKRLPVSIALVVVGLATVFLALHIVDELDRRGDKPWQSIMVPKAPPKGRPLARSPGQAPALAMPPSAVREMRDRLIRGELDRETMESFREFPDYDRCQKCISACDSKAEDIAGWQAQECRRNCLRTCSEHGSRLLEM